MSLTKHIAKIDKKLHISAILEEKLTFYILFIMIVRTIGHSGTDPLCPRSELVQFLHRLPLVLIHQLYRYY